jgi:hypothetical protein
MREACAQPGTPWLCTGFAAVRPMQIHIRISPLAMEEEPDVNRTRALEKPTAPDAMHAMAM